MEEGGGVVKDGSKKIEESTSGIKACKHRGGGAEKNKVCAKRCMIARSGRRGVTPLRLGGGEALPLTGLADLDPGRRWRRDKAETHQHETRGGAAFVRCFLLPRTQCKSGDTFDWLTLKRTTCNTLIAPQMFFFLSVVLLLHWRPWRVVSRPL